MVESSIKIPAKEFLDNCDLVEFARKMNYPGNPIGLATDHGVSFYRSTWNGKPCYFTDWSAYECIFLKTTETPQKNENT